MKLLYIDESENKIESIPYYLVLAGIFIDSYKSFDAEKKIEEFKRLNNITNLKELRDTKKFKQKEKLDRTKQLADILKGCEVKILSVIEIPVMKNIAFPISEELKNDLYYNAVYLISERATLCAHKMNDKWILVADIIKCKKINFTKLKERIKNEIRDSDLFYFGIKIKDYMLETPFFVEDEYSNFIQIADLVALSLNHAFRNYLNNFAISLDPNNLNHHHNKGASLYNGGYIYQIPIEELNSFSEYLDCYWPLFDRSPAGKISGWGIKIWYYYID